MKIRLDVHGEKCLGRITHEESAYQALDIRVEGENLAEVLAKLINTFTEWQAEAMRRLREVGALGDVQVLSGRTLTTGEPS